jgi:Domain of unknown function (DUF4123)
MITRILTFAETARIRDQLFATVARRPGDKLYALLDGARSPQVHSLVNESRLPSRCLYAEPLLPPMRDVAPYLVEMPPAAVFNLSLIAHSFGRSWGVFLETAQPIEPLRAHLRQFLRVEDEQDRRLLFRFYDPRVLRVFLPTCTVDELRTFFGPIHRFHVESDTATALLGFSIGNAGLLCEPLPVELIGDGQELM